VSTALQGYLDWPGAQQVFRVTRRVVSKRTGVIRDEVVYGVTSLAPAQASAPQLLQVLRQHWHIENRSHWVRDVTFGEDASHVRCGSIPQVMAALRNTIISVLRRAGATNLATARRRCAARPAEALALLGISVEN
jgi:predicted transposase YbfD/YdcC